MAFLEQLAEEIHNNYGNEPGNICVVLPNRRAGLFLKKFLAKRIKKTFLAPEIYSIEDFFVAFSGYRTLDQVGLLFELYRVYRELTPDDPQDFDSFVQWGQVLLSDFNELDLYMADPVKIFRDISDTRALTVWNLDERPLTPFEKNYLAFYRSLLDYYLRFRERLIDQGGLYQGLINRVFAENIQNISKKFTWDKIYFAGLNALSKSEEVVIRHLMDMDYAEVFWDADKYYLDDAHQEAGNFIREYIKDFKASPVKWIGEHFAKEKEIKITGIPGHTGQAIYTGHILNSLSNIKENELHRTAVVLADEQLMLPMLNSLPQKIDSFNITMGYPLKLTPVYHFIQLIFRMHLGSERIRKRYSNKDLRFYVRDVIRVMNSPYLKANSAQEQNELNDFITKARSSGKVIYTSNSILKITGQLPELTRHLCQHIFTSWDKPLTALDKIQAVLEFLKTYLNELEHHDILEIEYIYHFARQIRRVKQLAENHSFLENLKSLERIITQVIGAYTLPFYGEPLSGLQMMGVLETRAIDFDQLVLLSVNEGSLPRGKLQNSFIPFDIKREYGLPTHREKDAIFAYHFYRLLQRAKKIHLLYETEGTRLGGGEKSRFITQLLHEMPSYNPGIKITEQVMSLSSLTEKYGHSIRISTSPAIREKLLEKAERGISPSALNTFIQCSLRFYFHEIAGIRETEEVEETIENSTLGNVVHHALHLLFKESIGQTLSKEKIDRIKPNVRQALEIAFQEKYPDGETGYGKNLLITRVARIMLDQFLGQQTELLIALENSGKSQTLLHLEEFFDTQETIDFEGGQLTIKLKGKVDRIDQVGEQLHVIDYKTGAVKASELKIKDWESLVSDPRHGKAFQLLLYAYVFINSQDRKEATTVTGNISMRELSKGFQRVQLPGNSSIDQESLAVFRQQLLHLLETIWSPTTEFYQTEDTAQCIYCPFKGICGR